MRKLFALGFSLIFAGLICNTIGFVGIIILTLASGWALVDLAGKVQEAKGRFDGNIIMCPHPPVDQWDDICHNHAFVMVVASDVYLRRVKNNGNET